MTNRKKSNDGAIDKKARNREREKLLRETRLTPHYYIKKTVYAIFSGSLIGWCHWWLTSGSSLPDWISVIAAILVTGGYLTFSHFMTIKEINEDVRKWNRWSDSDI